MCPNKGFKNDFFYTFFNKVEGIIWSAKTQFTNLNFGTVVNWPKYFFVNTHNFFWTKKGGLGGTLGQIFTKTYISQMSMDFPWENNP